MYVLEYHRCVYLFEYHRCVCIFLNAVDEDAPLFVTANPPYETINFDKNEINTIHGPIGIKLGGKSPPEIALSIIAQLILKTYNK